MFSSRIVDRVLRAVDQESGSARSARGLGPARFAIIAFLMPALRIAWISNAKRQTADIRSAKDFFMAANVSLLIWVHWLLVCDPSAHQSSLREAIRLLDLGRMRKHASRLMRGWLGRFTIESIKVSSRARLVRDLRVVPHWPSVLPSSSGSAVRFKRRSLAFSSPLRGHS